MSAKKTKTITPNLTRRLIVWAAVVALVLMIPLGLTIRDGGIEGVGWNWSLSDFIFMGALLFAAGAGYELVARKMGNVMYRTAVGLAIVTSVLLVWINGAVGIIGDDDGLNLMYFAALGVGLVCAFLARFKPSGMAWALLVTAIAIGLVPVTALLISNPYPWGPPGIFGVFLLNSFFALLYLASSLLFLRASKKN